jgi:CheY-like chemotaxis protein
VSARARILIVEDDRDTRDALLQVLNLEGYEAVGASDGKEALIVLRTSAPPQLILLDLMMPVMDGWQFREEQLQDPQLADIPVLVVSAHANVSATASALRTAGYLKKPLDIEQLLERVARHCTA